MYIYICREDCTDSRGRKLGRHNEKCEQRSKIDRKRKTERERER